MFIICSQIFASDQLLLLVYVVYLSVRFPCVFRRFLLLNFKEYTLFTGLLMRVLFLPIIILTPLFLSCPFISSTTHPSIHLFRGYFSSNTITISFINGFMSFVRLYFLSYSRNDVTYSFSHRDQNHLATR